MNLSQKNIDYVQTPAKYFIVGAVWDRMRSIPRSYENVSIKIDSDEELYEAVDKFETSVVYRCEGIIYPEDILSKAKEYKERKQREEDERQFEILKAKLNK